MRLVCPNCSAQYEIDASVIPDEGRDVQCSNCGHTWFELPPAKAAEASLPQILPEQDTQDFPTPEPFEDDEILDSVEETLSADAPESDEKADDTLSDLSEPSNFDDDAVDAGRIEKDEDDVPETPAPRLVEEGAASRAMNAAIAAARQMEEEERAKNPPAPEPEAEPEPTPSHEPEIAPRQRRPADAAALDILREEAEREMSQRRAPPSEALETQTDLGLESLHDRRTPSRALRARMAHMGEELPPEDAPEDEHTGATTRLEDEESAYEEPRRDLLPGIDEINSTLKPSHRKSAAMAADAAKRSGFRIGFLLVMFVVIGLVFTYAQAPAIARALPGAEPPLTTYVDRANALRDWVDGLIN